MSILFIFIQFSFILLLKTDNYGNCRDSSSSSNNFFVNCYVKIFIGLFDKSIDRIVLWLEVMNYI